MQNGILSGGPAVRAVVLDLDGTLVDSAADIAAALSDVFEAADLPRVGADAVESALGFGAFQLVRTVLETVDPRRAADDAAVAALLERYLVRYAADPARHSTVYADGVAAVTDLHRAGVRLGVCTNKDTALSEAVLDAVGLGGLIDVVLGRDAVPHPKPDPRHLLDVLDRLGGALLQRVESLLGRLGEVLHNLLTSRDDLIGQRLGLLFHGLRQLPLLA